MVVDATRVIGAAAGEADVARIGRPKLNREPREVALSVCHVVSV
jgi:hypothetical protein